MSDSEKASEESGHEQDGPPDPDGEKVDETSAETIGESFVRTASDGERPRRKGSNPKKEDQARANGLGSEASTVVNNNFYAGVDTRGSNFGAAGGSGRHSKNEKVAGRLEAALVETVVAGYAEPDCFADALRKLRADRVLVLEGNRGVGRRAGGIALLREVKAQKIVLLQPWLTLRQLGEREYDEGIGYLVVDRTAEQDAHDAAFNWSSIRDQLEQVHAYLIVTSLSSGPGVTRVTWERPSAPDVLFAQLRGRKMKAEEAQRIVADLERDLPDEVSLAGLAAVAELIVEGTDPSKALVTLHDNAAQEVRDWFTSDPNRARILEATVLCFLEGIDVRRFEAALDLLRNVMVKRVARKEAKELTKAVLGRRADRVPLMRIKVQAAGAISASVMVFEDEAYARCVLEELWHSQDNVFWDGVAEWLDQVVVGGESVRVASGLARLAAVAFDEVDRSYLYLWAYGWLGKEGQFAAIYVLWYLCGREGMGPLALRTAIRWARDDDIDLRSSAVIAFSGLLGVVAPAEAVNQLWRQLAWRDSGLQAMSCGAIALLFANLVDDPDSDGRGVLAALDPKMRKYGLGEGAERMHATEFRRMQDLTMSATLAVLDVNIPATGRPAIIEYLNEHMRSEPERLVVVAGLWAGVLRHRPLRAPAIRALRRSLRVLRDISKTPQEDARALGVALARALPEREHEGFKKDFNFVNKRLNRGRTDLSAAVVLACLNAISTNLSGGAL